MLLRKSQCRDGRIFLEAGADECLEVGRLAVVYCAVWFLNALLLVFPCDVGDSGMKLDHKRNISSTMNYD